MTEEAIDLKLNKNMIKEDVRVGFKAVKEREFYVIVEEKVKMKDGSTEIKSFMESIFDTRLRAKNILEDKYGDRIVYFGAVV